MLERFLSLFVILNLCFFVIENVNPSLSYHALNYCFGCGHGDLLTYWLLWFNLEF